MARVKLDSDLGTLTWSTPGAAPRVQPQPARPGEPAPPAWWHGDEEASQSFFAGMGMLPPGGPRGG